MIGAWKCDNTTGNFDRPTVQTISLRREITLPINITVLCMGGYSLIFAEKVMYCATFLHEREREGGEGERER